MTIGSDGVTDWIKTEGQRFNLGPVSALRLVSGLVPRSQAKRVLDTFLSGKEAQLSVDPDKMWTLLAPHRARWSADVSSSIITPLLRGHSLSVLSNLDISTPKSGIATRNPIMSTIFEDLTALETHMAALKEAGAKKASNLQDGIKLLFKLAGKIKSPNQSKNQTYYNLGAPQVHEVGDKAASEGTGLSFDTYQANTELATAIIAQSEETSQKIAKLAKSGRKFNASKAQSDVKSVADKVAGILKADLTAGWVKADLTKLAARAEELHGLFAAAKV